MQYNIGLSENEWYIMQVLWDYPAATLRKICDELYETKGWTKHAVTSFLKRMETKGAIKVDESGKVNCYKALWSKEDTILKETGSVLERIYNGDLLLMVSNAVKQQELSAAEIKELKDMLDNIK